MNRITLLILAIAVSLASGCSRNIEGEAFIVTKGRSTVKLSLLEIFIMDRPTYDKISAEIDAIKSEADRMEREGLEEQKALHPERQRRAIEVQMALEALSEDEASKERYEKAQKEAQKINLAVMHIDKKHMEKRYEIYKLLNEIPKREGLVAVKTNSDGRFVASGVSKQYGIFARTSRSLVDSQEDYMWFFSSSDGVISLNNENLMGMEF